MRQTLSFFVIVFALAALAGCSRSEAATQPAPDQATSPPALRSPDGAMPRLVFFLNPNGRPCQIQQRVLDDMGAELTGKVELVYYRTTARDEVAMFNRYGVRSLPALVLTDAAGREVRRATPGIQDAAAVRRLIGR